MVARFASPKPSSRGAGGAGCGGFTLVELLLVVAIIALSAALVMPALQGTGRHLGLSSASYELLWLPRQARWHSTSTGQTCLVRLTPVQGGYSAEVFTDSGDGVVRPVQADWARTTLLAEMATLMQIPPDLGQTSREEMTIRFTPGGVDADYVVALDEDGRGGSRIEVRRPSGLVWLVPASQPGPHDGAQFEEIDRWWRTHAGNLEP